MCSKKYLCGLLVCLVLLSSPLFAWFSPKEKKPAVETVETVETTPVLEESETPSVEPETEASEEPSLPSETSTEATDNLSDRLNLLEETLKENKVKESKFEDALQAGKDYATVADAEYAELKGNYESLRADYDKAFAKAEKYKFATPFVQVNAMVKDVLDPTWGVEGVIGARFGHVTTQIGAGYFFDFDNSWNKNLEIKAGIGWEF